METQQTARIVKVGSSLALVIPAAICRALEIHRGERFVFGVFEDGCFAARKMTDKDFFNLKPKHQNV